jgi:hypothetical protein
VAALDPDMPQGPFIKSIKVLGTEVPPQLCEEFEQASESGPACGSSRHQVLRGLEMVAHMREALTVRL